MTRLYFAILWLAWFALLCLPARAESTTERALAALCGPRAVYLAPMVEASARRHLLHPVTVVALMKSESPRCDPNAVNRRTLATGLTQILPTGSANHAHLSIDELKDPATNLSLGARHLARLLTMCGTIGGAFHVYHGHKKCAGWERDKHVRKALRIIARTWRALGRRIHRLSS